MVEILKGSRHWNYNQQRTHCHT